MSTGNHIPAELTERYANEPYILLLEEGPYTLSRETLEKHAAPADLKHKRYHWPHIKFLSLHQGMLELEVTSNEKTFTIAIQVEKDMLQVVCSCATPVEKLCVHAYNTLDKLLLYKKEHYFEQFRSGGLTEFALANKTRFVIKDDDEGLAIQPKPAFGKMFSSSGNNLTELNNLLLKGIPPATLFKKNENTGVVHGYALIYSGRKFHLPLVLPFIGKLNKAGNAVKSFIDFIRTETGLAELQLTPEQAVLHKKCFRMFKLAEQLPYKIFTDANDLPAYIEWFQLLKQTWLLLLKQPFVYGYYSYRIRLLKKRILKQYTGDCQLHAEPVQLSFVLTIKADYYTLKPVFSANGKVLDNKSYEQYSALIMHNEDGDFYLLNSLIDIAALEYIDNFMQGLTIFKPYFDEFSNGLLKALCERYPLRCVFPAKEQLHYETVALKPVKKILAIHEHSIGLLLFPFIEYDNGKRVSALQKGTIYLSEKNGGYELQKRDKSYEAAFVQQLLALQKEFSGQLNEDCFYIAMEGNEIASWIETLKATLTDCSIKYP